MPTPPAIPEQPPLAALLAAPGQAVDALLADFATQLQMQGWRVRGLIQGLVPAGARCRIELTDIATRERYPITQDLGPGSVSCGLDPTLIAEAGRVLRQAADEGADLVIINRFGSLEATGEGFASDLFALASAGIPTLTVVGDKWQTAWQTFTGGLGETLPAELDALHAWFRRVVPAAADAPDDSGQRPATPYPDPEKPLA